jgi:general secretion pathway protein F
MPVFEYSALNSNGKQIKGTIDAENVRIARHRLRVSGIFPTAVKEADQISASTAKDVTSYFRSKRLSLKDLSLATRQLATLLGAGLPLVTALQSLSEQSDLRVLKKIAIDIREDVEEGNSLASALRNFPDSFPKLYVNMVSSGEASGKLDTVLENLADYLESQLELRRKVLSALLYPVLILGICVLVIIALLAFVVPRIVEIFERQGALLPLPTRIMIAISDVVTGYWLPLLLMLGFLLYLLKLYYASIKGREKIDLLLLKLPIYGSIFTRITTARVARTLSALLSSGVGLLASLDIAKNIVTNIHFELALEEANNGVKEGRSLARELSRGGFFPQMLCQMVAVGEKSGELEAMLDRAASAYEKEVDATLNGLTSLLEPAMMIAVGVIVFGIVISVLLPMADMITVVQ